MTGDTGFAIGALEPRVEHHRNRPDALHGFAGVVALQKNRDPIIRLEPRPEELSGTGNV